MSLFNELKRRNVTRVAMAYVVAAWLIIQVVETILPAFGYSDVAIRYIVIVLAIAFIPTLVFSWAFEITPEGLKREVDVARENSITRFTGKKLDRIIMVLLALALGYFAFDKFVLDPAQDVKIAEIAARAGADRALEEARLGMWNEKSIAVLPFINRSQLQEDEWFSDGIHDELLSRLARIGALKVISRTSVMRYRDTDKSLPEIARELSVATILEGGVQRVGQQVRINVQLINAHTDEHMWAEIFDRELTAENLFAIQSEIAAKIADALDAKLTPQEESRIHDLPTSSIEAYNHYLHGRRLLVTYGTEKSIQALQEFEQAVEIDPEFALAWVGVADASMETRLVGKIDFAEVEEKSKRAVEKALALDDQLGEAYATLAWLYWIWDGKWEKVEAACNKAIEFNPNSARIYLSCLDLTDGWTGLNDGEGTYLENRLALLYKVAQLDPLSSTIQFYIGANLEAMGRYDEAVDQYNHLLQINPDYVDTYTGLGGLHERQGRLAEAIQWYRQAVERDQGGWYLLRLAKAYVSLGDLEAVASLREQMKEKLGPKTWVVPTLDFSIKVKQGKLDELPAVVDSFPTEAMDLWWVTQWKAEVEILRGDLQKAHEYWLKADPRWADPDQWQNLIEQGPEQACKFSGVLMGTGHEAAGQDLLSQLRQYNEEILPGLVEDIYRSQGPWLCYLVEGSYERALDFYEQRIERGYIWDSRLYGWNWRGVKWLPWWDPIRDHPRYLAMVRKIDEKRAEQREILRRMDEAGTTVP